MLAYHSSVGSPQQLLGHAFVLEFLVENWPVWHLKAGRYGRDRNAGYPAPLAQIPACATNALGSCLGFWRQSVEPDNRVKEQW